jgi:membrane-bound lytic murein transglycosylase D
MASNDQPKSTTSSSSKTYKVRSGDSLWSISKKFPGVSIENIKEWNDISGTNLKVGTTLKISG